MHLPTKVNSLFVTTYLAIKHNSDPDCDSEESSLASGGFGGIFKWFKGL